eukprot:1145562-Pelagomonas_calceolata.AAC.1
MAVLDVQFTKLPDWSCAASHFFKASHIAEYSMAKSDQDCIGAAGGTSSLIRNAGVKELGRCNTVRDLLSDVHIMLSKTVCAAYIHVYKGFSGRGVTGGEAVQSSRRRVYARRRMADSNPPDPH